MVSISYGCGFWGAYTTVNWDTNTCANVLDGNPETAYGATAVVSPSGQAQFGVMTRIQFLNGETPISLDGTIRLYTDTWGSMEVPTCNVGWGYVAGDQLKIVESIQLPGKTQKDLFVHGRSDYALFAVATGHSGNMSSARAKIREIEFVELWQSIPPPTPAFDAAPRVGVAPLEVQFTDKSSYPGAWLWEFGDGATSDVQNPSHIYEVPGLYSVALTVANYAGQNSVTAQDYILVLPPVGRRRRAAWQDLERPAFL